MNDTQHIQHYLEDALPPEERILMEARLLIDPALREKMLWQQRSHELVRAYGRQQLRLEIAQVQKRLFTESRFSAFTQTIKNIFR